MPPYTGSKAQTGRGATLSIGSTPVTIGELDNIPFDFGTRDIIDVTNLDSGEYEESLPSIIRHSNITLTGNRVSTDAGQTAVQAAFASGELSAFTLTLPAESGQTTGDTFAFNAYVLSQSFTVSPTAAVKFSIQIRITGPVNPTEGTAAS